MDKEFYARQNYNSLVEVLSEIKGSKSLADILDNVGMLSQNQRKFIEENIFFSNCFDCSTMNLEEVYVNLENIGYFECSNCNAKYKVNYEVAKGLGSDYGEIEEIPSQN